MLTFALAVVELPYPLPAGCVCAFELWPLVLSSPPQAATANEVNATRRMPEVALRDLVRDICCSVFLVGDRDGSVRVRRRPGSTRGDGTVQGKELEQRPVDLVGVRPQA